MDTDTRSCCMSAPLSLCVLISFLSPSPHPSLSLYTFTFFQFLLCSRFLFSLLRILAVAHSISYTTSHCLCLSVFLPFLFSCLCPSVPTLHYVVRAPAVDYQSVDSQRAAKASSTNMRQYPNDWLVGRGPWKQASISA